MSALHSSSTKRGPPCHRQEARLRAGTAQGHAVCQRRDPEGLLRQRQHPSQGNRAPSSSEVAGEVTPTRGGPGGGPVRTTPPWTQTQLQGRGIGLHRALGLPDSRARRSLAGPVTRVREDVALRVGRGPGLRRQLPRQWPPFPSPRLDLEMPRKAWVCLGTRFSESETTAPVPGVQSQLGGQLGGADVQKKSVALVPCFHRSPS